MSRFRSLLLAALRPYQPGEQPQNRRYVKLNTNESPFAPAPAVAAAVAEQTEQLMLYSDPESRALCEQTAAFFGLSPEWVLMTNGSDEALSFAFQAFGDPKTPFVFPAVTYGFYEVLAGLYRLPVRRVAMRDELLIEPADFHNAGGNVVLANPNAPTGLPLTPAQIEGIVAANPNHVVIIDEAYIDFGGKSCLPLLKEYDNLLITRTFSKSAALAGARLGFCMGNPALIEDCKAVKDACNPYNVNRMTMAAGAAALRQADYYRDCCRKIAETRELTRRALYQRGFTVVPSATNFLFAKQKQLPGRQVYEALKERGVLVRHFALPEIQDFVRITIGLPEQMDALLRAIDDMLPSPAK